MPILQISLSKAIDTPESRSIEPAEFFAEQADIDPGMVTVYVKQYQACYGNNYEAIVHLFLPDLWSPNKIKQMLKAAAGLIEKGWNIPKQETIIMVQQLSSGHVFDRGRLESW